MLIRSRKNVMKKSLVAVAAIAALGLSACGSGDKGGDETSSSSTAMTTTSAATSSATTSATSSSSVAPTSETSLAAPTETAPANDPVAAAQEAAINADPKAPVDGGSPASPADAQAITALVTNINQATTLRSYIAYVPNNTCSRVIEENGGQAALDFSQIPDVPLNSLPNGEGNTSVDSVTDIMVNGNQASATVTATGNGQTSTATQRFLNEGGTWKFCD